MKFLELKQAVKKIKEGSLITYSGMQLSRPPMALLYEIVRQEIKGLNLVSIPNALAADLLIGAGLVKSMKTGFNGFFYEDGFIISPNWRKAVQNNKVELYETDVFEILQGLKASAQGLEEIEVPGLKNSDYIKINKCKTTDKGIITKAIKPDFALIHAQAADKEGNIFIEDPLIEEILVKASKNVIVTVEEVKELKKITIPKEKITSVSLVPHGSFPAACFKNYNYNLNHIRKYVKYSKEDKFKEYLEKYILNSSHEEFLEKCKKK